MASLTFELEQFSKGYFLAWIVTTQCWNKVEVTLKVGNTEYLHASKTNRSTGLQVITQSSRDHNSGETPILTINVLLACTRPLITELSDKLRHISHYSEGYS